MAIFLPVSLKKSINNSLIPTMPFDKNVGKLDHYITNNFDNFSLTDLQNLIMSSAGTSQQIKDKIRKLDSFSQ